MKGMKDVASEILWDGETTGKFHFSVCVCVFFIFSVFSDFSVGQVLPVY